MHALRNSLHKYDMGQVATAEKCQGPTRYTGSESVCAWAATLEKALALPGSCEVHWLGISLCLGRSASDMAKGT